MCALTGQFVTLLLFEQQNVTIVSLYPVCVTHVDTATAASACPAPCTCSGFTVTATCHLVTSRDYLDLSGLDDGVRSLTCVIHGTFIEDDFRLIGRKANWEVTTLVLTTPRNISLTWALWTDSLSSIERDDTFNGFVGLRHLSVNIVLNYINPTVFVGLVNLETLDLSRTQLPDPNIIAELLDSINMARLPVTTLKLRGIQGFRQGRSPSAAFAIKLRDTIYRHTNKLENLRELDLQDNEVIEYQPGITEYLPKLEILRLGMKTWLYYEVSENNATYRGCSLLDLLFHPSLKEVEVFVPYQIPDGSADRFMATRSSLLQDDQMFRACEERVIRTLFNFPDFHSNSSESDAMCDAVNCFCDGATPIPCRAIRAHVGASTLLSLRCYHNIVLPTPRSLETLVLRNSFLFLSAMEDINICVRSPNNMSRIALSPGTLGMILNYHNLSVTGLKNLTELNLENNGIIFGNGSHLTMDSTKIEKLYLGYNRFNIPFEDVPLLRDNPSIGVVDLQYSALKDVSRSALKQLQNLHSLNLAGNEIKSFDVDMEHLRHLEWLNLSHNQLRALRADVRDNLDTWVNKGRRIFLDLSLNPLDCLCHNLDFVGWLQNTRVNLSRPEVTTCSHPTKGRILTSEIDHKDLTWYCKDVTGVLTGVFSGLAIIGVVFVVVGLYRQRWAIRYWLHIAREA